MSPNFKNCTGDQYLGNTVTTSNYCIKVIDGRDRRSRGTFKGTETTCHALCFEAKPAGVAEQSDKDIAKFWQIR